MPAGLASTCTRGGGGVPAVPGTMASAMLRAVGSTMCARGAMGTTRELYVAAAYGTGRQLRPAQDSQVLTDSVCCRVLSVHRRMRFEIWMTSVILL